MKFDHVYDLLRSYRAPTGEGLLFLLQKQTMESIYNCVLVSRARSCLELGTGYGASTCIIAAALDELGGGKITTVDMMVREPIGVDVLAAHTCLSKYIDIRADNAGYNWYLAEVIQRQTKDVNCEPCFDFCFLDGAHEWGPDALAAFLVTRLLRPGAWMALDDLDFKLRGCQQGWENKFADRSAKELDARQVQMVFDLVVRQSPEFTDLTVADAGRTGWARKIAATAAAWQPAGQILGKYEPPAHSESVTLAEVLERCYTSPGLTVVKQGDSLLLSATDPDPWVALSFSEAKPISHVELQLRVLAPSGAEVAQIFWAGPDDGGFAEERSVRVPLEATGHVQDVKVRLTSSGKPPLAHALRFDITEGPSSVVWSELKIY
jgi:predicted O-methyltransferase YrrM